MDFKGQARFDLATWLVAALFGVLAFAVGYWQQDFELMAKIFAGASLATADRVRPSSPEKPVECDAPTMCRQHEQGPHSADHA